jgi:hypothetical protein
LTTERRRLLEIGGRVLFVVFGLAVLPDVFWADLHYWWTKMNHVGLHRLPYRDILWEFPPMTVVPVTFASLMRSSVTAFSLCFATLMAVTEYATLELLRARHPDRAASLSRYWYAVLAPLASIAYFRFDHASALFAVMALLAIERGRAPTGAIAIGFATKLWPAIVGVVLVIERRYRELVAAGAVVAVVLAGWYAFSPSGFDDFLRFRRGDGFQVESVVGSWLLLTGSRPTFRFGSWVVGSGRWNWIDPTTTFAWVVLTATVVIAARRRPYDPWALVGGIVLALMLSSRLLSPQFLAWGFPFVAVAWVRGERIAGVAFGAAAFITAVNIFGYEQLLNGSTFFDVLGVLRNALLGVAAARLLVFALTRPRAEPAGERDRGLEAEVVEGR